VRINYFAAMQNILQVLPDTKNVAVVVGTSPIEQFWREEIRKDMSPFANRVAITFWDDLSFEDILKRAAALPSHSAIFWELMIVDAAGVVHDGDAAFMRLHATANAPIFGYYEPNFGQGVVGGPYNAVLDSSRATAAVAVRILGGEKAGDIRVPPIEFAAAKFDWREMQRWGIGESRLPPGSEIDFRDPTAWDRYKAQILTICAAILVQATLISWLLIERRYRQRAEATTRDVMSELTHMNRLAAAGELSASIAHEVNQPLTGIVARAGTARRWLTGETPEIDRARAALDQIERAGLRASEIVQNVRAIFKNDSHNKVPVDINRIILSVVALARHEIQKHQIELRTDLDDRLPSVAGNEVQLQQVILNLLMNAIEALHFAQPRVLRIQSNLSNSGALNVSIEDSGSGIKPSELDRIFKPLFTTKGSGMGMGLSICRSIIETHGGRIWASPGTVTGSVFRFELPTESDVDC
jgi:signal transduction histidine kinase